MNKIVISTLIFLLLQNVLSAQTTVDIFTISGRYTTPQPYDSMLNGKAKESGGFVALTLPIPLSEKIIFYNTINYFYYHVNNEPELEAGLADPTNLHGIILRTGLVRNSDNGNRLQLLFAPRYMSDMQGGGSKNWQFGGIAAYDIKFNNELTLGFGAMFNKELFGPYLVPLVNLNWQASDKLSIFGMLPVNLKIKYAVSEKFAFGFSHFGLATTFRLNNAPYAGDYIERQSIDLSLFAEYNIAKNFYIEGRLGRTMGRVYKQYSEDQKLSFAIPLVTFGDDRVAKNISFEDGLFCDLRLIYRIKTSK